MMAMAVVTLALCIGLVAQVGLSFWLAVTVSAAFYMGLLTLHALVRRHDQLDELRTEVDRLTGEVARLGQMGGPVGRTLQPAMAAGASGRTPQTAAASVAPPVPATGAAAPTPPADPLARVAAAMPAAVKASSETHRSKGADSSLAPGAEAKSLAAQGVDDLEAALSGAPEARDPAAGQMQKIVRAPQTLGSRPPTADERGTEQELLVGSVTAQASEPGMRVSAPPLGVAKHTRRHMVAEAHSEQTPFAESPFGAEREDLPPPPPMRTDTSAHGPDTRRSRTTQTAKVGESAEKPMDVVAAQMSGAASTLSGAEREYASDVPAFASEPSATAAWAYRPGDDARQPAVSPSESDVEMIQELIKKLADEVNSADAQKLASGRTRTTNDDEALDRSVGALRQAARNMQEPLATARGSRATHRVAGPEAASASDGYMVAGTTPMQRPLGYANNLVPPTPETSAAPELDVEALMRRAQPIATMTSMPPPLPAAPNIMDKRAAPVEPGEDPPPVDATKASIAEDVADDIWNAMSEEVPVAEQSAHDEIGERVARIADALEAGRFDVFLEPILDLEKQQARHFEVSVCLRDESGAELSPDDPAETERPSGILPLLDSVRLQRTAHVARRLDERNKQGHVFSTFSGQSLTADDFLSTFAETYEAQVQLAGQLILTFSQADARRFRTPHWTMINEMRDLGFGFALRAVTDLDMDFETLAKSGFKFVKLDAEVFLSGLPAPGAIVPAADLCKHLEGLGLMPVVEAIDDDAKREQVYAYGVRLGQGRVFGGARQIKTPAASGARPAAA